MIVKPGRYEHYKGGLYQVLGIGKHSETQEALVIYYSLDYGTYWARPISKFLEPVSTPFGNVERFTLLEEATDGTRHNNS